MLKNIVIVSSGQPAANPRAVKEALLLKEYGCSVVFIYCPIAPMFDDLDKKIFEANNTITWIKVGSHPKKNYIGYKLTVIRRGFWKLVEKYTRNFFFDGIKSTVLFSQELTKETLKHKADLYIGHNLGAIGAVYKAANKYKAKVGFDAEDFHRGEFLSIKEGGESTVKTENIYIPLMDYCTVASPLIGEAYKKIFPKQNFTVINNVFSKSYLNTNNLENENNTIKLFWFSQFIGPNRGLETVVKALNECHHLNVTLHLLGNISESYQSHILQMVGDKNKILFTAPTSLAQIFELAATCDIGLATEVPDTLFRDYCLTNKIFTYLLAGNAILFSDTKAQTSFFYEHPTIGLLYKTGNVTEVSAAIKKLYNNRNLLLNMKQNALQLAKEKLNWEIEGLKFLKIVNHTLNINEGLG